MKRLLLFLPILFVLSCSETEKPIDQVIFELSELSLPEKMKKACEADYLKRMGLEEEEISYIQDIYKRNDYTAFWINDSSLTVIGDSIKRFLEQPLNIGLPEAASLEVKSSNFIQDEIAVTLAVARGGTDQAHGYLDLENNVMIARSYIGLDSTFALLNSIVNKDSSDLSQTFLRYAPTDSTYRRLYTGLQSFLDRLPYDSTHFNVKSIKEDSSLAFEKAKEALVSKGYYPENKSSISDSLFLDSIIKLFQVDNGLKPDGVIGKYTAKALNESTVEKLHRIVLTMEKIRRHKKYPSKYIVINLPEYYLRFFEQDSLRSAHRIVIGKTENQTPELESKLSKIIVYPYWNVPYSISSKEILPVLKYNVGYLEKNNYKLYKNGEQVDPYSVNWKKIGQNSFPFKVVQDPGPKNSLGILKFDFYNAHSVYFHDTPSKALFGTDIRSYSHGCMRTQAPVELAKKILEYDSIPRKHNVMIPDSLDTLLSRGKNYEIKLLDRIPIYVIYQTVTADQNGMIVHIDIYDRDKKYFKTILKS